jgi:Fe-S-cluster containining protein
LATTFLPHLKPKREEVAADDCLCNHCTAKCCRYFALPIDKPEDLEAFDYIYWFMLHDRATVFVEDDTWYLLVHTVCRHLQPDNRCGIYETRPQICRDYTTDNCEYEDTWVYDAYFEHPEQVREYVAAIYNKPGKPNFRSAKPAPFPILT